MYKSDVLYISNVLSHTVNIKMFLLGNYTNNQIILEPFDYLSAKTKL